MAVATTVLIGKNQFSKRTITFIFLKKEGKNMKKKDIENFTPIIWEKHIEQEKVQTSKSKKLPIWAFSKPLALTVLVILSLICGCISLPESETRVLNESIKADLIFTAPDPVTALSCDQEENIYIVTNKGDITKIDPDGKSKDIYSGLNCCGFSNRVLTINPDGDLIVNDCIDNKDIIIKIDQNGRKTTLMELEEILLSIASDSSGRIFLGIWDSEGDISVSFQPFNHLSAADHLSGQILVLGEDSEIDKLYEGGLPLALATSKTSGLYASIWGNNGRFHAEAKNYSFCDPRYSFWICLSDTVEIKEITGDKGVHLITSGLDAVSSIATNKEGFIFVVGTDETGCGIYEIKQGHNPQRVLFPQDDMDESITGLALSDSNLYFSDVDGNVYRVGLSNLYE